MKRKRNLKIANILRFSARYSLLTIGIVVFIFALLSGSEGYGNEIQGIVKNSPNALPWLLLLVFLAIAWKFELTGGILIIISGFTLTVFFNAGGNHFYLTTFIMTSLINSLITL